MSRTLYNELIEFLRPRLSIGGGGGSTTADVQQVASNVSSVGGAVDAATLHIRQVASTLSGIAGRLSTISTQLLSIDTNVFPLNNIESLLTSIENVTLDNFNVHEEDVTELIAISERVAKTASNVSACGGQLALSVAALNTLVTSASEIRTNTRRERRNGGGPLTFVGGTISATSDVVLGASGVSLEIRFVRLYNSGGANFTTCRVGFTNNVATTPYLDAAHIRASAEAVRDTAEWYGAGGVSDGIRITLAGASGLVYSIGYTTASALETGLPT